MAFNRESIQNGYKFEQFITKLFEKHNFTTNIPKKSDFETENFKIYTPYDFKAEINEVTYVVEVKYYRLNYINTNGLYASVEKLVHYRDILGASVEPVVVISSQASPELRKKFKNCNVKLLDISNLLYIVEKIPDLKQELLTLLDYSVNEIVSQEPEIDFTYVVQESQNIGEQLKETILNWKSISSGEYENLCEDTLKFLFDDELALWRRQKTSNRGLYRFDLLCKIKDGDVSGLWNTIFQCFNTKYIIFEFKNYKKKITQKEVYTTEKYLYLKALRGVAFIISAKGPDENAQIAMRGVLKENGKLIISIDNKELIKMIDIKLDGGVPADYLYDKFDNMLIELDK